MIKKNPDCTVLILTYKGKANLEALLPSIQSAIKQSSKYQIEVEIINNGDDFEVKELVERMFPEFKVTSSKNDFLFSYNPIVNKVESEVTLILNDDLKVAENIFNETISLFDDPKLFSISCLFKDWDSDHIQLSWCDAEKKRGWFDIKHKQDPIKETVFTFYSCGGAAFYRTAMFNELKGFDKIYYPAYYEDGDLCHRAWNKGWFSIAHPIASVEHKSGVTWKKSSKQENLAVFQLSNRIIGMLVNCHSSYFLRWFVILLPYRLLYSFFFRKISFRAYKRVIGKINLILKRRKQNFSVSDEFDFIPLLGCKYSSNCN